MTLCLLLPHRTVRFGDVARENLIGQTLAGYRLQSLVGEGGTSVVYQAEHPVHGMVAVKVLREKLRYDRTAVTRFLREAKYGTRVAHTNVIRTIEIGEAAPGMHFLATEWAGGEILDRYVRRSGPLPVAETADIISQVAKAVQAAHGAGIVHRDLKPDNIMYDPKNREVKLLDFGIAMDTDTSPEDRLTRAGFFVGTLMYVAPEAISGALVTPAADQYSLATIAYFLLTATLPYSAKTPREMFTEILSQPPKPLNRARKTLTFDTRLEKVIMRALSRDPDERFSDVASFDTAFQEAVTPAPAITGDGLFASVKSIFRRAN